MKIAFVSSESNPFSKTGGLGDVVYSLSKELSSKEDVSVFLPFYESTSNKDYKFKQVASFYTKMSWRNQQTDIYYYKLNNVNFYFLANSYYFTRHNLYGYGDDGERFAFFSLAVIETIKQLNLHFDIIHCNDWQTGMIPCLVKKKDPFHPNFSYTKFIFTIHNPMFMGLIDRYFLNDFYSLSDDLFDSGELRFEGMVSTFKAGIVYSDKITTVSPTHALELLDSSSTFGLSYILTLRKDDFVGICNGIDESEFNPKEDSNIAKKYSIKDVTSGKKECKKAMFDKCLLEYKDVPCYGLVSRLTSQKGIELVLAEARKILNNGGAFFALGSGEYAYEQALEDLRRDYPDRVGIYIGYNAKFAHYIYAGCDFFLMPSLFEPCGIGQMIALKYGTLPIARRTGGLADTIVDYNDSNLDKADGFLFNDFDIGGLDYGVYKANLVYNDKAKLRKLRSNAMKADHSWNKSSLQYLELYKQALNK